MGRYSDIAIVVLVLVAIGTVAIPVSRFVRYLSKLRTERANRKYAAWLETRGRQLAEQKEQRRLRAIQQETERIESEWRTFASFIEDSLISAMRAAIETIYSTQSAQLRVGAAESVRAQFLQMLEEMRGRAKEVRRTAHAEARGDPRKERLRGRTQKEIIEFFEAPVRAAINEVARDLRRKASELIQAKKEAVLVEMDQFMSLSLDSDREKMFGALAQLTQELQASSPRRPKGEPPPWFPETVARLPHRTNRMHFYSSFTRRIASDFERELEADFRRILDEERGKISELDEAELRLRNAKPGADTAWKRKQWDSLPSHRVAPIPYGPEDDDLEECIDDDSDDEDSEEDELDEQYRLQQELQREEEEINDEDDATAEYEFERLREDEEEEERLQEEIDEALLERQEEEENAPGEHEWVMGDGSDEQEEEDD